MNVLIADDERLIVEDLKGEVLALYPEASVDGAESADGALRLAEKREYDVALLDIEMPGLDGLALARRLIAMSPAVNIIFVTGHSEYALDAHELYCSAFLLKPVGQRKLRDAFGHLRNPFLNVSQEFYAEHYSGGDLIGRKLQAFRRQRGLARHDIADLMGVTRQTVHRWEHGERIPDVLTFVKLARILGISIEDVLSGSCDGEPDAQPVSDPSEADRTQSRQE